MDANSFQKACVARETPVPDLLNKRERVGAILDILEQMEKFGDRLDRAKKYLIYKRSWVNMDFKGTYHGESHNDPRLPTLVHAAIGVGSEAGEFAAMLRKAIMTGEFDVVNAAEELSDLEWYLKIGEHVLGYDTEEIFRMNDAKLEARNSGKTFKDKIVRDETTERSFFDKEKLRQAVKEPPKDGRLFAAWDPDYSSDWVLVRWEEGCFGYCYKAEDQINGSGFTHQGCFVYPQVWQELPETPRAESPQEPTSDADTETTARELVEFAEYGQAAVAVLGEVTELDSVDAHEKPREEITSVVFGPEETKAIEAEIRAKENQQAETGVKFKITTNKRYAPKDQELD